MPELVIAGIIKIALFFVAIIERQRIGIERTPNDLGLFSATFVPQALWSTALSGMASMLTCVIAFSTRIYQNNSDNMSANCAPVYNFYNCCCEGGPTADGKGQVSGFFVWLVDNALQPAPKSPLDPIYSGGLPITIDADKKGFVGLQPLHRKARLVEISLLRVFLVSRIDIPSSYPGTILLDLLVMDLFGNILRTISLAPVDYKSLSEKVWTPISLTASASALEIQAGEAVIARVSFSAPDLASPNNIRLQPALSAIGEFI